MINSSKIKFVMVVAMLSMFYTPVGFTNESGISLSVRVIGGGWSGKNKTSNTEFESTEGGQLGLNATYQNGGFYTGLNLQGGEYTFEGNTPDQVSQSGTTPVSNDKVEHSELDLVFGYYLNQYFSLFAGIKGTSNTWASNGYKQDYSGGGIGATGTWPVNKDWTLYGSLGVIPSGQINVNDEKVGEGTSRSVDIGGLYQFSKMHRVMFGIKRTTYVYTFDSGDEQVHSIGGAYFGYSYAFSI